MEDAYARACRGSRLAVVDSSVVWEDSTGTRIAKYAFELPVLGAVLAYFNKQLAVAVLVHPTLVRVLYVDQGDSDDVFSTTPVHRIVYLRSLQVLLALSETPPSLLQSISHPSMNLTKVGCRVLEEAAHSSSQPVYWPLRCHRDDLLCTHRDDELLVHRVSRCRSAASLNDSSSFSLFDSASSSTAHLHRSP